MRLFFILFFCNKQNRIYMDTTIQTLFPKLFPYYMTPILPVFTYEPTPSHSSGSRLGKARHTMLPPETSLLLFLQHVHENLHHSWKPSQKACTWRHVACDADQRVVRLIWHYLMLRGNLTWHHLPSTVRYLHLTGNELRGEVELRCLGEEMTNAFLNLNSFAGSLDLGSLPPSMENFFGSQNEFQGELDLTSLPAKLQNLHLGNNRFHGTVDLEHLPRLLRNLHLGDNALSGRISLLRLPRTLHGLYLHGNDFVGGVDVSRLPPYLQELGLQRTRLLPFPEYARLKPAQHMKTGPYEEPRISVGFVTILAVVAVLCHLL